MVWAGIDGEGLGRNPHRYVLLASADDQGGRYKVENVKGLSTYDCLCFLVSLPFNVAFSYAFQYDLTMMLRDLSDRSLYRLLRPELRRAEDYFIPVEYRGFRLNLIGTKFSVGTQYRPKSLTIWDTFKFFQCKFTKALEEWKVETDIEAIETMKNKRSSFTEADMPLIREYCFNECVHMGILGRLLVEAHKEAGLDLKSFYGAGSTGGLLLDRMSIAGKRGNQPELLEQVAKRAFFGGRFENAIVGPIQGPVYNYDISSAYPYGITRLPCLEHVRWRYTTDEYELESAYHACVRWSLRGSDHRERRGVAPEQAGGPAAWGPFPFRTKKGNIIFPIEGGNGWAWLKEYRQAAFMFPNVVFGGAFILERSCNCQPFADVPKYYRERVRWGKDGKGRVLKLGINAVYGKVAQSVGLPRFASWVWAGMITSGTRAMILSALNACSVWSQFHLIATDGIYTTERLTLPPPEDTGTYDVVNSKGQLVPLGGWEEKIIPGGMFACRPGVNFPLDPAARKPDIIRGRGFGRKAVYENADAIMSAYYSAGINATLILRGIERFHGAKSCVRHEGSAYKRYDRYGSWSKFEPKISFNPMPKRLEAQGNRLIPHSIPQSVESAPYKESADVKLELLEDIDDEQPD